MASIHYVQTREKFLGVLLNFINKIVNIVICINIFVSFVQCNRFISLESRLTVNKHGIYICCISAVYLVCIFFYLCYHKYLYIIIYIIYYNIYIFFLLW